MEHSPTSSKLHRAAISPAFLLTVSLISAPTAFGNGIDRNGIGSRSMALAGATVADTDDTFNAVALNPGALGFTEKRELWVTTVAAFAEGDFEGGQDQRGSLEKTWGVMPELGFRMPLSTAVTLGLSVVPDSTRTARWSYPDVAGGAGGTTQYDSDTNRSTIINVRAAAGLGWRVTDTLSLGANVGVTYNRNELSANYIFQSHPALTGAKTQLQLETEGYAMNADAGMVWKPIDRLAFGLAYRSPTEFNTSGQARGNIGRQLKALGLTQVPGGFRYDADVATALPQKITAGLGWQVTERLRLSGQVDWVNWSQAFDELPVKLSNGSNAGINRVLGSRQLNDTVPLKWEDRFVFRYGMEYELNDAFTLRAGYAYGKNPVPDATVLPMTAGIAEHSISAGIGYKEGPFRVDLAWQYDLPNTVNAGSDGIAGTEYDHSRIRVSSQWVGLSLGFIY